MPTTHTEALLIGARRAQRAPAPSAEQASITILPPVASGGPWSVKLGLGDHAATGGTLNDAIQAVLHKVRARAEENRARVEKALVDERVALAEIDAALQGRV